MLKLIYPIQKLIYQTAFLLNPISILFVLFYLFYFICFIFIYAFILSLIREFFSYFFMRSPMQRKYAIKAGT